MTEYGMLMTALPSREDATVMARLLVEERLAACVQLLPIESVYRWEGDIQGAAEVLLLVKTRIALFDAAIARIRAAHPHAVPEITGMPFTAGFGGYFDWIGESTQR